MSDAGGAVGILNTCFTMPGDVKIEEHSRKWSTVPQWRGGASSLAELALAIPELGLVEYSMDTARHDSLAKQAMWKKRI